MRSTRRGPRHAEIAATLRAQINDGELAPGTPLSSEAQLSARFGVSRGTVRQALAALRTEGLVAGGRGRVPVVRQPGLAQSFDELVSFSAWALELGRVPGARTLELVRRRASAVEAEQLALAPDEPVFVYHRLRLLDGQPVMVEHTTFVDSVGRLLLDADLDGGSVYAQLGERGVVFAEAQSTISAVAADTRDAELLGVPRRSPLLEVRRRAFDGLGVPLEWSIDRYRGELVAISVHNRRILTGAGVVLQEASAGS